MVRIYLATRDSRKLLHKTKTLAEALDWGLDNHPGGGVLEYVEERKESKSTRRNPLSPEQSFAKAANGFREIDNLAKKVRVALGGMQEFEDVPEELLEMVESIQGVAAAAMEIMEEMTE